MFNKVVYILISLGGDRARMRYVGTHTTSGIYILIFEAFSYYYKVTVGLSWPLFCAMHNATYLEVAGTRSNIDTKITSANIISTYFCIWHDTVNAT